MPAASLRPFPPFWGRRCAAAPAHWKGSQQRRGGPGGIPACPLPAWHGGAPHPRLGMSRAPPRRPLLPSGALGSLSGRSGPGALAWLRLVGEVGNWVVWWWWLAVADSPGAAAAGHAARRLNVRSQALGRLTPRSRGCTCAWALFAALSCRLLTCPARACAVLHAALPLLLAVFLPLRCLPGRLAPC